MTNDKVTEAEIDAVVEAMAVELIGYTDEAARVTARQVVIAVKAASPRPTGDVVEAIAIGMTPHEKLNRALTAAKPHYPGWSIAEIEKSSAYLAVLEALTDLDKPIPDADEAWRPAADAYVEASGLGVADGPTFSSRVAGLKAALPLIPEQYR